MNKLNGRLSEIQQKLKAPKGQHNSFGNYDYRSCEDILEAVKPLLGDLSLTISDTIEQVGDRYYVKATAALSDGESFVSNQAFAREEEVKKGMDGSQITGAASSYARKYALNGLFCIDDTRDADTKDNTEKVTLRMASLPNSKNADPDWIEDGDEELEKSNLCPIHKVPMKTFTKNGRTWQSHIKVDGTWCNGGAR